MAFCSDSDEQSHDDGPGKFLDLEASESVSKEGSEATSEHSFAQFSSLPAELRRQIWELFCPALTTKNVWEVRLLRKDGRSGPWMVGESATLSQQTESLRAMLATDRQSRELALRLFPNSLSVMGGTSVLRFHSDKDVILVSGESSSTVAIDETIGIAGFCGEIKHLAVDQSLWGLFDSDDWYHPISLREHFPNLQGTYICVDSDCYDLDVLRWCTSDSVNQFYLRTTEIEEGLGEDAEYIYAWPDLAQHADFARAEIPVDQLGTELLRMSIYRGNLRQDGVELWPMVRFGSRQEIVYFDRLASGDIAERSDDEDGDEEPDEYESEGINDEEIEEEEWTDEEDDLAVLEDDSDADDLSPQQAAHLAGVYDPDEASFSSPAPVSDIAHESDDAASDDEPHTAPRRSNKRRIVASSDVEEDSDGEPRRKRARAVERRVPAGLSDSDDDADAASATGARGVAVVNNVSDSDSDSNSDDEEEGEEEEEEEEEDDEEDEEEDELPKRPLSLVERLRLGREEKPIDDDASLEEDDEEDDEDEDDVSERRPERRHRGAGGGYGHGDDGDSDRYTYPYDDEDEDEDKDEEGGAGLVDDQAEESDSEGEVGSEEDEDGR